VKLTFKKLKPRDERLTSAAFCTGSGSLICGIKRRCMHAARTIVVYQAFLYTGGSQKK